MQHDYLCFFLDPKGVFTLLPSNITLYFTQRMLEQILTAIGWLAILADAILLVVAILYSYHPANPGYLRIFPIYCLGAFLADFIGTIINRNHEGIVLPYTFYNIFEIIFLTIFMFQLLDSKSVKRIVFVLDALVIIYYIVGFIKIGITKEFYIGEVINPFILLILYLAFFLEIFKRPPV